MSENKTYNKFSIQNGDRTETLLDLSNDGVDEENLLLGVTAHDNTGSPIVGSYRGGGVDGTVVTVNGVRQDSWEANTKSSATNLENGDGIGSLVQVRVSSEGEKRKALAYQRASSAFGGNTQAGQSFDEWLVDNPDGTQEEYNEVHSFAFSNGELTKAPGRSSHAEGNSTESKGEGSHSEGKTTKSTNAFAHSEGSYTEANGNSAHSEGDHAKANGTGSHAEGAYTIASGNYAHAEGSYTEASGSAAHAEGDHTTASKWLAHAEGRETLASGNAAHAEGFGTKAQYDYQHASGKFNANKSNTLYEVGNGTSDSNRKNAFEVYTDGHAEVQTQGNSPNSVVIKSELDTKVDKRSGGQKVYVNDENGNTTILGYSEGPYTDTIAKRDSSGCLYTQNPTAGLMCVNKQYVDNSFLAKSPSTTASAAATIYGKNSSGAPYLYNATEQNALAHSIAQRNATGGIVVGYPMQDNEAASKAYVDTAVAGAGGSLYFHQLGGWVSNSGEQYGMGIYQLSLISTSSTPITTPNEFYASCEGIIGGVYIDFDRGTNKAVIGFAGLDIADQYYLRLYTPEIEDPSSLMWGFPQELISAMLAENTDTVSEL